ncbi:hypothetical protein K457DRAFT_281987 [Linnemannia elongata AG-77]|uniref:Uncharacterized protein n=1 Tax=Linnemannia elongata AG-77 TaxID=1314771 RepID=A0A197JCG2_9FUNG|nr:hypothetical protein K457DRAFT_281987 [Linnemannia elongata AG-77]
MLFSSCTCSFSCSLHEPRYGLTVIRGDTLFITKKHPDIVHDLRVVLVGSLHEPLNCERLVLLSPTTGLVEQSNVVLGLHFALQGLLRIPLRSLRLVLWYSQHPARKDSSQKPGLSQLLHRIESLSRILHDYRAGVYKSQRTAPFFNGEDGLVSWIHDNAACLSNGSWASQ